MSDIAVWTDSNGKVEQKHFYPDTIDTSDAYIVSSDSGSRPDVEDWVTVEKHYNPTDGFFYKTSDPLANSPLTKTEKQKLYEAFTGNDINKARTIVENALNQ